MSIDAGGLAQMTYNNHNSVGNMGIPSGFGSRGKGGNIKRLSVPPPSKIGTIEENQPAPRTSRSHLLAGLRTAPKSPGFPTSASTPQLQQPAGLNDSRFAPLNKQPQQSAQKNQTSFSQGYHHQQNQYNSSSNSSNNNNNTGGLNQFYLPEQVLAPPSLQNCEGLDASQMDPQMYEELVRTNQYLAQQQMRLQQQLINVTAAAQQFQNMNLGHGQESTYGQMGMNPSMSFYNQQLSQGMQPVVQPVPGNPGLYTVYNPMTGQTTLCYDDGHQEQLDTNQAIAPQTPSCIQLSSPAPQSPAPANSVSTWRSNSPPKASPSPPRDETLPLPPPSANAFRAGHRKNNLSLASSSLNAPVECGMRTSGLKSSTFPPTPMTGTFGPGQAREGEHPVRQPRGPPSMEELVAKPTTKFEGSKNFASRQRRGALNHLVRAGLERRTARSNGSVDGASNGSPTSERNLSLSVDNDDISVRSGSASLDGQPESDHRSTMISAIGSERKELKERSRERTPRDSYYSTASVSSEDEVVGGKLLEIKNEAFKPSGRKSPLQILANAEKRRSLIN